MVERHIRDALDRLLDSFVGPAPLPAGGAAGVAAIAMGAAIGAKVARMSHSRAARTSSGQLEALMREISPEFERDCAAFDQLLVALKTPKEAPDRAEIIRERWLSAARAPVRVVALAEETDRQLAALSDSVKKSLRGDLQAARILVQAGRCIAISNAEENAQHLPRGVAESLLAPRPPQT